MWTIDEKAPGLKVGYPYFSSDPIKDESQGTYAEKTAKLEHNTTYGWNHPFSEILGSLLSAGLSIDFLHEHTFCAWDPFPDMEQDEDKFWRFKDPQKRKMLPLMFSLKATKPTM